MSVYHKSPFFRAYKNRRMENYAPLNWYLHHVFQPLVLDFKFEIPNALCYWYLEQVIFSKI